MSFGDEIGEFVSSKPLIASLLGIIIVVVLIGGSVGLFKTSGNWMENADFLRQTMAPAFNETTGFLMISYAVILCIGNVIMKTSPKYLTGVDEATQEKTTGFVAWLQSRGLSWLPVLVSTTVITLMTFLPIDNKMFKIIIISVVLLATLIAALFFNTLIKLFGGKEEFTNVKEEFGHLDSKGNPHDLQITIKVEPSNNESQPDVIRHEIQDGTPEYPHKSTKGDMKIAEDGQGGSWNIPVNTESLTNTVTLIKSAEENTNKYRIFITDVPFYHPDADTKHNIRELFSKSSFDDKELEKNKKVLNDSHYKQAGHLNITATAATTNLYFHAIKRELFFEHNKPTIAASTEFKYPSSLPNPNYNASATGALVNNKFTKLPLNFYQRDKVLKHAVNLVDNGFWVPNQPSTKKESTYKRTVVGKILTAVQNVDDKGQPVSEDSEDKKLLHTHKQPDNTKTKVAYEAAAKLAEKHRETESKELYTFLKNLSGGTSYEKPNDKTAEAYRMVHHIDGQDYTNNGMRISLQNNELFFGFDVKVVKDSVRASYISYYALVWGSFLVYTIVTFIQKKEWTKLLGVVPIPKIPKSLLLFMGAAAVETLLIGQSHYSLDESDIGAFGKPSPTFSYAVAGFSTRIATVVAFLSTILSQVDEG